MMALALIIQIIRGSLNRLANSASEPYYVRIPRKGRHPDIQPSKTFMAHFCVVFGKCRSCLVGSRCQLPSCPNLRLVAEAMAIRSTPAAEGSQNGVRSAGKWTPAP